jgi:cytochrome c5
VIAGDAARLAAATDTPLQRDGLRARVVGELSALPLLMRRAGGDASVVPGLRDAAARGDWQALRSALEALQRRYPHDLDAIASASPTPERLRLGQAIHAQACAGCHDAPAIDTRWPARNLHGQAAAMPRAEFAARLYLGVRGDRSTAYRNPFSDLELGALLAWYYSSGARAAGAAQDSSTRPPAAEKR